MYAFSLTFAHISSFKKLPLFSGARGISNRRVVVFFYIIAAKVVPR
jgi:hypothetical protein